MRLYRAAILGETVNEQKLIRFNQELHQNNDHLYAKQYGEQNGWAALWFYSWFTLGFTLNAVILLSSIITTRSRIVDRFQDSGLIGNKDIKMFLDSSASQRRQDFPDGWFQKIFPGAVQLWQWGCTLVNLYNGSPCESKTGPGYTAFGFDISLLRYSLKSKNIYCLLSGNYPFLSFKYSCYHTNSHLTGFKDSKYEFSADPLPPLPLVTMGK